MTSGEPRLQMAKYSAAGWEWVPFPLTVAVGAARNYLVESSATLVWTLPLRAMMQTAFFTLLGLYLAGQDVAVFAFVGAVGFATSTETVTEVLVNDRWQGTMYRLRLGHLPILKIMMWRCPVYLIEGVLAAVVGALTAGPWLVGWTTTVRVLAGTLIIMVCAGSLTCLWLAVAAAAIGRRTDMLLTNITMSVLLATAGVVLPAGRSTLLDTVGQVVPLRHGLTALRAWVGGRQMQDRQIVSELVHEVAVGAGWLLVTWALLAAQAHRARRGGFDEYT
jgi:ABC-2 type transport system permease protein